ncbi:SIN3A family protein [Megaselia abdita]
MGMMKRSRVEELPYSSRTAGVTGGGTNVSIGSATSVSVPVTGTVGHHRLLSQHAPVQYQLNTSPVTGVSNNSVVPESIVAVTASTAANTQAVVQYSAYNIPGSGIKSPPTISTTEFQNLNQTSSQIRLKNQTSNNSSSVAGLSLSTTTAQATLAPQTITATQPRLKVEDALSYLDKVKFQYSEKPQIYNNFLDIMKEFKSQSIDTPGVIQRVSTLFHGHTDLIYGFNMFLPPGYKIEIQSDDQGVSVPVVSMPSPPGSRPVNVQCLITPASPASLKSSNTLCSLNPSGFQTLQASGSLSTAGPVNLMAHASNALNITTSAKPNQPPTLPSSQQLQKSPPLVTSTQSLQPITSSISQNLCRERTISQCSSLGAGSVCTGTPLTPNPLQERSPQGIQQIQQAHQIIMNENASGQQPVEFNHAITYVNKIKNRFHDQPDKYKRFLEILHRYQKEQKLSKDGSSLQPVKTLTEAEVYTQVAQLFDQQEDLLREFGQFLPDATNNTTAQFINKKILSSNSNLGIGNVGNSTIHNSGLNYSKNLMTQNNIRDRENYDKEFNQYHGDSGRRNHQISGNSKCSFNNNKKSPSFSTLGQCHQMSRRDEVVGPPSKRHKPILRDVTLAEASRYGTLADAAFFDKLREALRSTEVYENFLRCLTLYNQEIVSKSELLTIITPFLSKFPELHHWFTDFLGPNTDSNSMSNSRNERNTTLNNPANYNVTGLVEHSGPEVDLSACKRLGASYCALPQQSSRDQKKCSGRTSLCREVLNDTWVSFPTWASEDSTFVSSRKTQFEEIIYRTEDERFELDVVIETNNTTIRVLEGVQKKISRMSPEEVTRYRLDDCLGGSSPTIQQRALKRLYGDKAADIIQGLKNSPAVAVPVVLRRLKAKEEEWREAQKGFNKQWREQNEKYYLKSLDHQSINFKPNDIKALRSKILFNEIESLFDERHEQNDDLTEQHVSGPHLILHYKDKTILDDAANLLIHHVKRQTGIQKTEKAKIKHVLRQLVPDLFFSQRHPMSDDERDDDENDKMDIDSFDTDLSKNSKNYNRKFSQSSQSSMSGVNFACNANNDKKDEFLAVLSSSKNTTEHEQCCDIVESSNFRNSGKRTPLQNLICRNENSTTDSMLKNKCDSGNITVNQSISSALDSGLKTEVKEEIDDLGNLITDAGNLPPHAVSKFNEEAYTLFFANNNWYLFIRLHAILCERLHIMYERSHKLATEQELNLGKRDESIATALRLKQKTDVQTEEFYPVFLDMLKNVLDGNMDSSTFEDSMREMYGIHAYISFTLDKVVSSAVRQLQYCVTEKGAIDCVDLFLSEQKLNGAGGLCKLASKRSGAELSYQHKAEAKLQDENCFKICIFKIECRVTIELLDTETEENPEKIVDSTNKWNDYVDNLKNPLSSSLLINSGNNNVGNIDDIFESNNLEIKTETLDEEQVKPKA